MKKQNVFHTQIWSFSVFVIASNTDCFYNKERDLKKPRIGVDLDDTVIEFATGFTAYHNSVYGGALERHHLTTWHLHEILGVSESEATRRIIEFYHSDDHHALAAVSGAKEALLLFRAKYEIIGITAREAVRAPRMLQLMKRHFEDLFTDVHFLGTQKKKGDCCTELAVRFMVDDGLHNAQSVGEQGIRVYLMDKPWNQCEVLPPNTIRVFHWDDIVRLEL